jgi:aminodeoxyfutalosine deaminase
MLTDFIQSMPKAELHVHLEGTIQPSTVLKLARRHNRLKDLPGQDVQGLADWFRFTDFSHFLQVYLVVQDLLRTPDDFALITYECGADMAEQNIRYREVTVTPYTHTDLQKKGLAIERLIEGLEAGRRLARQDFGVEIRWIFDIPRNASFSAGAGSVYDDSVAARSLEYALIGRPFGVIGFGLGGHEVGAPPEPFAPTFRMAKEAGLLSVPHAGETVGPASVWGAVQALQADRIGHGVRAIEDPALLEVLRERQIALEINPTSNICLHVFARMEEHPFARLDGMGLLVTVNSDDPPLFNTTLSQEYRVLANTFGYGEVDLVRVARNAFAASGAEPELKERLLREFDAWAAQAVEANAGQAPGGMVGT